MNKKKETKKTECCAICKLPIYLDKDNYCRLTDYKDGKFYGEQFYHITCFKDKLSNKNEMDAMKKYTWNLLQKANKQLGGDSGMELVLT